VRVERRVSSLTGDSLTSIDRPDSQFDVPEAWGRALNWIDNNRQVVAQHPLLRPIVGQDLHRRIFQEVIKKRAVPLLRRVIAAQAELRTESADRAREKSRALLDRLKTFDYALLDNPDHFFDQVQDLSRELDSVIEDANYATFGQLALLHQLKALNVGLRTSGSLWHMIRMGHAMREPGLQTRALEIGVEAQSIIDRGWRGDDITRDLAKLESDYLSFKRDLDSKMDRDSGLGRGLDAIYLSKTAWGYRSKLERAILVREGRQGESLSNNELCAWVRANGIPPEVVREIYAEDVLPVLRAISEDADKIGLHDKAEALMHKIENAELEHLRTADEIEIFTIDVGRDLDALLADAEKVAGPADPLVRRLRESRMAPDAVRKLLLGLRINETIKDPAFTRRAQDLMTEVQAVGDGDPNLLDQRLAHLEHHLVLLGEDAKARLHVDSIAPVDKGLSLIRAARKAVRLRGAAALALTPELKKAVDAFGDLEMSADKRRAIYQEALGKPLLESVVALLMVTREVELGFSFEDVGRGLASVLHAGGDGELNPLVAKSPLAFLARADFESALGRLDSFLDNANTPERREAIDATLNVVRAVATVEADALGHVAARIPDGHKMSVATASLEWLVRSSEILLEFSANELAEPSGMATAEFLDLMVDATEDHLDGLMGKDPRKIDEADFDNLRYGLRSSAVSQAKHVGIRRAPLAAHALTGRKVDGSYAQRLRELNGQLLDRLACVETTPESRKAVKHIVTDVGATLRTIVNLVHLFGAASNNEMDPDERTEAIQLSVERMGPLFVKLMQTLANMQTLLAKLSPDFKVADNDPLFSSLKKLQDEVTPLPWPYIEKQIRSSLGLSGHAPLSEDEGSPAPFVTLSREPLKSGSIGQTHRATIRVDRGRGPELVDTVVKVLRPDIDKTFEDTLRITRLTMLVFKELLRLDVNASIFGEVKPEAERVLAMLERSVEGFIQSFRIETNFQQEAENMRKFKKLLETDSRIVIPEVFDHLTKGNILTMEEIKGFKLSKWIERYRYAEAAPKLAEDMGPIAGGNREALKRAKLFVEQTFGVRTAEVRIEKHDAYGTTARARFQDTAGRLVDRSIHVGDDGKITCNNLGVSRVGAETKAAAWGQATFGLPVNAVSAEFTEESSFTRKRQGYTVQLGFESRFDEKATVFVDKNTGKLEPRCQVPDLDAKGIEALRDRLTTTFGVQVMRGLVHGDPHEGNFFVLPDGKTIGLIDFGLAIELGMFDAKGPMKLLSGALLGRPKQMAEAMLGMSTQATAGPERDKILEQLTTDYEGIIDRVRKERQQESSAKQTLLQGIKGSLLNPFKDALEISKRSLEHVLRNASLAPSPRHMQAAKATLSMGGNLAMIEEEGIKTPKWKRFLRFCKEITIQTAMRPFLWIKRKLKEWFAPDTKPLQPALPVPNPQLRMLDHVKQSRAPDPLVP
jgi:predicted unusual protein kinase regulating ubiquinone biosynthesis (AarF/ABC1/UbiB family)